MKPFDKNRFDEAFRSKLGNFSELPPDQVFGKIRKTMSQSPAPGSSWFGKYWMFLAVTGITGLVIVSLSFINADDNVVNPTNSKQIASVEKETTDPSSGEEKNIATMKQEVSEVPLIKETVENTDKMSFVSSQEINRETSNNITSGNNEKSAGMPQPTRKPEEISVNVQVVPSTCRKANGSVYFTAPGGQRYFYYWSDMPQTSQPHRSNLIANTYTVRIVSEDGTEKNYEVVVSDTGSVKSIFSHYEISAATGIPVYFQNKSKYGSLSWETGNVSFRWYFGDGSTSDEAEPEHAYQNAGSYIVSLVSTSMMGCKDSTALIYLNITGSEMDVPTAFTPNNDGINDYFKPEITGLVQYKCIIYNRLGEKVYDWAGTDGSWDGKIKNSNDDASAGVYYYIIEGSGSDGRLITKKGFFQLFR